MVKLLLEYLADKLPNYYYIKYMGYILEGKVYITKQAITGVQILYTINKYSLGSDYYYSQDHELVIKLFFFKEVTKSLYTKDWWVIMKKEYNNLVK